MEEKRWLMPAKKLPEIIRMEEKKKYASTYLDEEQLIKKLHSNDQNDVLIAIDSVRERDINAYLPAIANVMVNFPKQSIRSFALLLLVQKKINRVFKFKHIDNIIDVNPSELTPPFIGEDFNEFTRLLSLELRNPSLSENAIQIISSYIIYIYPDKLPANNDLLIVCLYDIANEYLQSKDYKPLKQMCEEKGVDMDEALLLILRIKEALDAF